MRMWMVNPEYMCDAHLRTEHNDVHAIARRLFRGETTEDLDAEPMSVKQRHADLIVEMLKREMIHATSLPQFKCQDSTQIIWRAHSLTELLASCAKCRERILKNGSMDS